MNKKALNFKPKINESKNIKISSHNIDDCYRFLKESDKAQTKHNLTDAINVVLEAAFKSMKVEK